MSNGDSVAMVHREVADLSVMCFACGAPMDEEHAHYRCRACGWRDSCCDGPY